jgi:hypothetical protein
VRRTPIFSSLFVVSSVIPVPLDTCSRPLPTDHALRCGHCFGQENERAKFALVCPFAENKRETPTPSHTSMHFTADACRLRPFTCHSPPVDHIQPIFHFNKNTIKKMHGVVGSDSCFFPLPHVTSRSLHLLVALIHSFVVSFFLN